MYWTVKVEGGPRRVNHAAVLLSGKIHSFGGYCSGEFYDGSQPIDVHVLDTETYRWVKLHTQDGSEVKTENPTASHNAVPYQRYGHTVVAYNGKAYLWGGRNDEYGACSRMHVYDPETLSWSLVSCTGMVPPARDGHSAVVVGDNMYMFGGFEEDSQRFSQETYVFNFKKQEWRELKTTGFPPEWRDFHTACVIGSKMYIFGGRSDLHGQFHSSRDVYNDRLKALDLNTNNWEEPRVTGEAPSGRRSHSAWVHRGKMYIFGGYLGTENLHLGDLYEFDPISIHWRRIYPIGEGPSARRRQCTVVVGNRVFLFGGTMPCTSAKYDPIHSGLCDLSDLHVLDYEPSLRDLAAICVLKNELNVKLDEYTPFDVKLLLRMMSQPNKITRPRHDG